MFQLFDTTRTHAYTRIALVVYVFNPKMKRKYAIQIHNTQQSVAPRMRTIQQQQQQKKTYWHGNTVPNVDWVVRLDVWSHIECDSIFMLLDVCSFCNREPKGLYSLFCRNWTDFQWLVALGVKMPGRITEGPKCNLSSPMIIKLLSLKIIEKHTRFSNSRNKINVRWVEIQFLCPGFFAILNGFCTWNLWNVESWSCFIIWNKKKWVAQNIHFGIAHLVPWKNRTKPLLNRRKSLKFARFFWTDEETD